MSASKSNSSRKPREQRVEHIRFNRDHLLAIPADQVEVLVVADRVVRRRAVAEVGVPHQAELLEHLEGAVDGGDVDRRGLLADLGEHLVRRRVAERVDGVEDQLALRGQAVALLAQLLAPVGASSAPHWPSAASPTCAAAAAGPSPPCRRRTAGHPRPGRRAACHRRTPWRDSVRTTASVTSSNLPAPPRRTRSRRSRCCGASSSSTLPSGRQRRNPVSSAASRTFSPFSSTIQARER